MLSEVYGFRATRRAIYTGFGALLLTVGCFYIAIQLPPAGFYENQEAFRTVLGTTPQLVLAGLAGYFVGQLLNSADPGADQGAHQGKAPVGPPDRFHRRRRVRRHPDLLLDRRHRHRHQHLAVVHQLRHRRLPVENPVEVLVMPITYRVIAILKKTEPTYAPAKVDALHD